MQMGAASNNGGRKQTRPAHADVLTAFLAKGRDRDEGQQQQQQKTFLHSFREPLARRSGHKKPLRVCQFMEPPARGRPLTQLYRKTAFSVQGSGTKARPSRRKLKGAPRSAAMAFTHFRNACAEWESVAVRRWMSKSWRSMRSSGTWT